MLSRSVNAQRQLLPKPRYDTIVPIFSPLTARTMFSGSLRLKTRIEILLSLQSEAAVLSITARPFFERRGYRVVREQQVERQGIMLTNFVMIKEKI